MVAVDDQREVIEPEFGRRRGRLPVLSLVQLAVTGEDIRVVTLLIDAGGEGVADSDRQALTERAGRRFDAGEALHVGVPLERAAQLAQGHDLIVRKIAGLGERGIEHRGGMPLGEDEPVAVGPVRVRRIVPQEPAKIEGRHDLDGRQRAPGMPEPASVVIFKMSCRSDLARASRASRLLDHGVILVVSADSRLASDYRSAQHFEENCRTIAIARTSGTHPTVAQFGSECRRALRRLSGQVSRIESCSDSYVCPRHLRARYFCESRSTRHLVPRQCSLGA